MLQTESLKIFQIITRIEQTLLAAPRPKMSSGNKRTIDIDLLMDLLGDLKVTIPEDIRRANSVLIEADTILDHAGEDAQEMIERAEADAASVREQSIAEAQERKIETEREFDARVSEHSVLLEAERRAGLLAQKAEESAASVYEGAKQYADNILDDVQKYLMTYHAQVGENRSELGVNYRSRIQNTAPEAPPMQHQPVQQPPMQHPAARPPKQQPAFNSADDDVVEFKPARRGLFSKRTNDESLDLDLD